jgi:hypothetical protein
MQPDLGDPATIGCLLVLARNAWRKPNASTRCWAGEWWTFDAYDPQGHERTEAEALVVALEAAR